MSQKTLILKFGGAAVASPKQFGAIARIVLGRLREHPRIITVVSAMGQMTDELIALAKQVHPNPPRREMDMLISVGERISISLLAMALAQEGHRAVSFTGSQSGIITSDDHTEAKILDVRPIRLEPHLQAGQIVIVAGFQGVSSNKEITTLGRGGSDTTAVALGVAIGAQQVEFYKDVAGIYSCDPAQGAGELFCSLSHQQAKSIASASAHPVLHPRAIGLAERNGIALRVLSFKGEYYRDEAAGTWIRSNEKKRLATPVYEG